MVLANFPFFNLPTYLTLLIDKYRLSEERKEAEREMRELKESGGPRLRKVDVEELKRKASRLGKFTLLESVKVRLATMSYMNLYNCISKS
jgi:hypothetical protein